MNLFVLNTNLDAVSVVDSYNSFIWTERYYEYGDFELYARMTNSILDYIKQDYYLQRGDSDRVMIIEKILIKTDVEEGNTITITGRSLESILMRRIIWGQKTVSGNLQDAIEALLNENIISPTKPERKISNFIFQRTDDPTITGLTIEAQYTGDNLYDVISAICSERGIGFKVTLNDNKQFVFQLYAGADRSYDQTVNPYVVFSPSYENLLNSNYMESKQALKNVTLVGGEGEGSKRRYTAVGNVSGLNRREMFTDARDISSDSEEELTDLFNFTLYPSQVYNYSTGAFVTDANFDSCMVDLSEYPGRTLRITFPKLTDASGAAPTYALIYVDENKTYISTIQKMEKYYETANRGGYETYEFELPDDVQYIYATRFSQKAIDDGIYYGNLTDFSCQTTKPSNDEYIEMLRQRGKEDLAENIEVTSFEGEIETTILFRYGEDFFNGDIIQIENEYGHQARARILEIVTSEDENGLYVYPTFSTITEEGDET